MSEQEMPEELYVMLTGRGYIGSPFQTEEDDTRYIRADLARPAKPCKQNPQNLTNEAGRVKETAASLPTRDEIAPELVLTAAHQAGFMVSQGYGPGEDKIMPVSDAETLLDFYCALRAALKEKGGGHG